MPVATPSAAELDGSFWREGMAMFAHYLAPWLQLADDARYQATVDRVASLEPAVIAGCHTPTITGAQVAEAVSLTRTVPTAAVPPQPGQAVLDEIVAAVLQPV